jgi:hypothetical protein
MNCQSTHRARTLAAFALTVTVWMIAQSAHAQDVLRVYETWELVVGNPDAANEAPQLNTVMSPFPHVDSYYGLLTINYRDQPTFTPGGLQCQLWNDTQCLLYKNSKKNDLLNTGNESITWRQRLSIEGGDKVRFHVENGTSTTWGGWAGGSDLKVEQDHTPVFNLNGYTPAVSVEYARRWGLGRERIISLRITSITREFTDGTVLTDNTPIQVLPN